MEAEMELDMEWPADFSERMKTLLQEEYPSYLNSFSRPCVQGIRVNTARISAEAFCRIAPFSLAPVPWTKNGFYVQADAQVTKHPYYYAGLYYVQEPSAMLPAALLDVRPGERVLDLCAAPGGKATELGSRLKGTGMLLANDVSSSRAKALLKNLELHGIANAAVSCESAQKLLSGYADYFDKILVDAPCSGEGMFHRDTSVTKLYAQHGPSYYAPLQERILEAAVGMLKPGGRLVYSTCTFSPQENEEILLKILNRHPQMRLIPVTHIAGSASQKTLPGCVRLYPHRVKGEGHFAALLEKAADNGACTAFSPARCEAKAKPADAFSLGLWREFSDACLNKDFSDCRLLLLNERLYALPPELEITAGIRYLRTGLYLGDCKKHGFEPSQALAMALIPADAKSTVSFSAAETSVIRYLKGEESLPAADGICRWTLVCVDGFALGWAKQVNHCLRNKYYAGWRMT